MAAETQGQGISHAVAAALAADLLALPAQEFCDQWRSLKRKQRDQIPKTEREACFNRYSALLGQMDVGAKKGNGNGSHHTDPDPIEMANSALNAITAHEEGGVAIGGPTSSPRRNGATPAAEPLHRTLDGYLPNSEVTAESVGVVAVRASEVTMRPVNWLWKGKLACGKISLIQGDPGLGKSMLTASLAAIVTTGGLWPVTRDKAPHGNVLILSAEDDPEDTLVPRLEAAGADLERVHIMQAIKTVNERGEAVTRGFDLSQDVSRLIIKMREIGDVRLVSLDPVLAFVGQTKDSHKTSDVRGILAPLNVAAYEAGAAIVLVNHLNKSTGQSAINRGQGSNAWAAAARAVFGVIADKEDYSKRYFCTVKNNLGADGTETNLSYSIESYQLPGTEPPIATARILWDGQIVTQSTKELFAQNDVADSEKNDTQEAADYLLQVLSGGAMRVEELQIVCRKAGHHWPTVKKAKQAAKIVSKRSGFGKGSYMEWMLPEDKPVRSYASRDD